MELVVGMHFGRLPPRCIARTLTRMTQPEDCTLALVREHYHELTDDEAIETRDHLRQYFQIARAIFERLQKDPELCQKYERLKEEYSLLTEAPGAASLNAVEPDPPPKSLTS